MILLVPLGAQENVDGSLSGQQNPACVRPALNIQTLNSYLLLKTVVRTLTPATYNQFIKQTKNQI